MVHKVDQIYGNLPPGWTATTVASLVNKGDADVQTGPFGTMLHASAYRAAGTPVVAVKNLGDNRLIHIEIPRVDNVTRDRLARYTLRRSDILFGRKGAVERRAFVHDEEDGWLQGSDCIRLRFIGPNVNARFVSYVLGSPQYRSWIIQNAQGATMPSLNQEIIGRIPLPLPDLKEQQAIACILGTLDDKIELNRRMNEMLEAMGQAVFKSWFVDFDPVRAKAAGQQPPGLAPHIADLFPDGFEESELGEIPRGWRVRPIGDVVQVLGGGTPSTGEPAYWEGGTYPFCTPKDMSSLTSLALLETERCLTDAGVARVNSGQLPAGTVLLSSRAPIGYLAIAEIPISVNQGIIAMVCDRDLSNLYVVHWAEANMERIVANANGSTFLEISKRNFRPIEALIPPLPILDQYTHIVEPLYQRLVSNLREGKALASIRDMLLPKLISGELRVPDAERIAGRCV